jgi:hypothetical protein
VDATVLAEIERLQNATTAELQQRYRELFGEEPGPVRRQRLFRRLAWRLQAVAEGGLSERARQRLRRPRCGVEDSKPRPFLEQIESSLGPAWSNLFGLIVASRNPAPC